MDAYCAINYFEIINMIACPPPTKINCKHSLKLHRSHFTLAIIAAASVLASMSAGAVEVSSWSELEKAVSDNLDKAIVLSKDLSIFNLKDNPDDLDRLQFESGNWIIDANKHNILGYGIDGDGRLAISVYGSVNEDHTDVSLTLKNIGNFESSLLHTLLKEEDLPSSNIGWYDGGSMGNISVDGRQSSSATLNVDRSIFQKNSTKNVGAVIQAEQANVQVSNSLFLNNISKTIYGGAIFADGSSNITVTDSTFYSNESGGTSSQARGGAIYAQGSSSVSIHNSIFQNNKAGNSGGALYLIKGNGLRISNSIFHGNTATNSNDPETASAGALYASITDNRSILIDSSTFSENSSDYYGGAIVINKSNAPFGLSVIQDCQFIGNQTGVFGAGITYLKKADTNNFLIAKHSNALFRDNHLTSNAEDGAAGEDIWLNYASMRLSVNAYADRIIEFSGSIAAEDSEEDQAILDLNNNSDLKTITNGEAVDSSSDENAGQGTIVFRNKVENIDLHVGNGTIVFADGTDLSSSVLSVNGSDTVISTIEPHAFDETTHASAIYDLNQVQASTLQKITLGGLSGKGSANIYLDVDLANTKADYFEMTEGASITDTPTLHIAHWNVLTDATAQEVVVAVADENLKDSFKLAESGSIAKGEVYTYNVERLDETSDHPGDYLFSRRGTSPSDLNGDVYAGDVAAAGLALASHLVDIELPRHRSENWWVNIIGTTTEMKPGNFHEVDYKYGIGLLGWRSSPLDMGTVTGSVGIFGGFLYGDSDYEDVTIRQNGALVGLEALFEMGAFWSATNVKLGTAKSNLDLSRQSTDISTTWYGVTETIGMKASTGPVSWVPSVGFSWLSIRDDDYRSSETVRVRSAKLDITEISPALTVTTPIANGWESGLSFRYNFVNTSGDKGNAANLQLESIEFEDYAEYGITLRKESNFWNAGLLVEKSSDGRQGWNFRADVNWRF